MFDIDDTLLNVNKNFKQIDPIVNLLKYSKKLGFLVIIITAREKTETMMKKVNKLNSSHI
jgi:hydroxymethylpyrimidine pyrophosphatase-like HAD family hydrolase